jgi:exosome complex RNA-binding protein Rrp42 (RNase PH superfamily)
MIYSNIENTYVLDCFSRKLRPDARELFDFRKLKVNFLPTKGGVQVKLGNTVVLAKSLLDIITPRADRPS